MLAHKLAEEEYEELPSRREEVQGDYAQRRLVRRKVVRRSNLRGKIALLVLLVTVLAGIITFESSVIASKGFEIVQIRTEAAKLEQENALLKISNAQMKNPQRIKEIAQQKLGMVVSDKVYFAEGK